MYPTQENPGAAPSPYPTVPANYPNASYPAPPAAGTGGPPPPYPMGPPASSPSPARNSTPPSEPEHPPRRLGRMFLVFLVIGLLLVGVGATLEETYYHDIAQVKTVAQFLSSSGATLTSNSTVTLVTLNHTMVAAGQSIMLLDTIDTVTTNASTGVTVIGFHSIDVLPAPLRQSEAALANGLFATLSSPESWLTHGDQVILTFTIVSVTFPGGPYGGQSYLTLDAQANALYSAIQHGSSGPQAVAISPSYYQPYPSIQYDGLFIFLMASGVALIGMAILAGDRIEIFFRKETKDPKHIGTLVMGATAILGGLFLPFYPWPAVLFIALVVMTVSWRYPQMGLIALVILVAPAIGYQSGALGFLFLFAAIPILFASLIDWKFGLGAFLTLFLAPLGLSFAVPIFFALVFSLYLGIVIAIMGGVLISLFITLGNLGVMGFLTGSSSSSQTSVVAGHSAALLPTLTFPYFSFTQIGASYGNIVNPDFGALSAGGGGIGYFFIPMAEVGTWCLAGWILVHYLHEQENQDLPRLLGMGSISGGLVAAAALITLFSTGYGGLSELSALLFIPATITIITAALLSKSLFEAYFTSQIGATSVGTRVADMKGKTAVTFEAVGGLHDVKADIKESLVIPLMRKDITTKFRVEPPKGLLLFGPPGCGKTMLMKALATELGVEMISVKASDLMSKWYGESENRIADLLKTARERAPAILFMDEIDAVAKRRDLYTADDVTPRILSILLSELDGIDKSQGVIVVGSTNKPDMIDPALMRPGRLDKIIYIPPPDYNERVEILEVHLSGRPVADDVDLTEIAKKSERFSGADLANLVREAATKAIRRQMRSGIATPIDMSDFVDVLSKMKPSISLRVLADYEAMKLDYERKMHQTQRLERKVTVKWDDVGGLEDIKRALREYVELPLTRPDLMDKYRVKTGKGLLLFGPPGCGKTHVMRAAANELNVPMQIINGPELVSALAGQSEAAVRDILYRARENAPSIVFFDEIDALASKDSMKTPEVSRAVSQFLTEMDGLRAKDKVIIVATTNRPQTLDPALLRPGRFDKILYVPPPDFRARSDIFRIHLRDVPQDGKVDHQTLALMSDGFSGADISFVVDESKLIALREQLAREAIATLSAENIAGVRMSDLEKAVHSTRSSVTPETLKWATDFIKEYGTRQ